MKKFPSRAFVLLLLAVGLSTPSFALVDENNGWNYRVQVGFGPLAVNARATVEGQTATFATNSNELLNFDTTGIKIRGEAWKGRWGITADNTLATFSVESRIDSANTVQLKGHDFSTELGGSYLLGKQQYSEQSYLTYEGMAGGRFVAMKQKLEYSSGSNVSDTKQFVDPYVGGRLTYALNNNWSVDVRGNVGGFGIGNGSELSWMVQPELNLRLAESTIINFGYRHYDVRTEKETGSTPTQFDGAVYGTFVGVELRLK